MHALQAHTIETLPLWRTAQLQLIGILCPNEARPITLNGRIQRTFRQRSRRVPDRVHLVAMYDSQAGVNVGLWRDVPVIDPG